MLLVPKHHGGKNGGFVPRNSCLYARDEKLLHSPGILKTVESCSHPRKKSAHDAEEKSASEEGYRPALGALEHARYKRSDNQTSD